MPAIIQNEKVFGASAPVAINDSSKSTDEVWSANKTSSEVTAINSKLDNSKVIELSNNPTNWNTILDNALSGNVYIASVKTDAKNYAVGMPQDVDTYGVLITFGNSTTWLRLQIYVVESSAGNTAIYYRTRTSGSWKRINPTSSVTPVS